MKLGNDPASRLALSRLERAALAALARGIAGDAGALLEAQAGTARVVMRSHSGVGFVTKLEVAADVAALPPDAARRVRPLHASHPELREPAELLVQLKQGRLASIEAFCHEGMWPADDAGFRILEPDRRAG
jgi:hypothetical protein